MGNNMDLNYEMFYIFAQNLSMMTISGAKDLVESVFPVDIPHITYRCHSMKEIYLSNLEEYFHPTFSLQKR